MAVYHQIGNDSANLLTDPDLSSFTGAVLSPVNYTEAQTAIQVAQARDHLGIETVLDPQLYVPGSERGQLRTWTYFPSDVDTADTGSLEWWQSVVDRLSEAAASLSPAAVCTPAVIPRAFSDDYYVTAVEVGRRLSTALASRPIGIVQTAVVKFEELADRNRSLAIASILSRSTTDRCYLVIVSDVEPRRELRKLCTS